MLVTSFRGDIQEGDHIFAFVEIETSTLEGKIIITDCTGSFSYSFVLESIKERGESITNLVSHIETYLDRSEPVDVSYPENESYIRIIFLEPHNHKPIFCEYIGRL